MPVILWTMQRTGGTSLGGLVQRLFEHSPKIEHEPFNQGRVWGFVSEALRRGSLAELRQLPGLLVTKPVLKHCFELHHLVLNLELLRAATHAGYKHIFHLRQDEAARIQSLFFALQVGAWHEGDTSRLSDAMIRKRLTDVAVRRVEVLIEHSARSLTSAKDILKRFDQQRVTYFVSSYEELYETEPRGLKNRLLSDLLAFLAVPVDELRLRRTSFARSDIQQDAATRRFYAASPVFEELRRRVTGRLDIALGVHAPGAVQGLA